MKTDHEIENMVRSGKDLLLSADEKDSIRTALLRHAEKSLRTEAVPSPFMGWVWRGSASFAVLCFAFLGTAYASQSSLPGEPLYAMKVNMTEEIVLFTKLDPSERTEYDISLMESRLRELKQLSDQGEPIEQATLDAVAKQIGEHVADITDTFTENDESIITHEEKMDMLARLSGVSRAQVNLTENEKSLNSIAGVVDDSHDDASDFLASVIEDFSAKKGDMAFANFLSDQISSVSEELNASTTDEAVRDAAEEHLHDVEESLVEGDTVEALKSIFEARQEIDSNEYLEGGSDTK